MSGPRAHVGKNNGCPPCPERLRHGQLCKEGAAWVCSPLFLSLYGFRKRASALDTDTFSLLQRRYDAKEVLGARVPTWSKHTLQASGGDLRFTGEFTKAYRCVDVVAQDNAACSKVTTVDELEPFAKKALAKGGLALCAFTG